jgi:5-methylcytosine-specific restriction endonuclease McrA
MTRQEACAQGLSRYFDGRPCWNGHFSDRGVSHGKCLECKRLRSALDYQGNKEAKAAYSRKWVAENPNYFKERWRAIPLEERKQRKREWYKANQGHARAYSRRWTQDNSDRAKVQKRSYYQANKEKVKISNKRWTGANPERVRANMVVRKHRRRALERAVEGTHTAADIKALLVAQNHACTYCHIDLRKVKKHLDHILPLALGGTNDKTNLQWLCEPCNLSKGAKHPISYAQELGRLL